MKALERRRSKTKQSGIHSKEMLNTRISQATANYSEVLITSGTVCPLPAPFWGFASQGAGILATSAKFRSARASFSRSRSFMAIRARHRTSLSLVLFIPR